MKTITLTIFLLTNTIIGLGQNLISNWTFADNLTLNCQDWYDACGDELTISCDTTMNCLVSFINDPTIPTFSDSWVLKLEAGFPQEGFSETYITGRTGTQVYQLKYWMKSDTTLSSDYSIGYASIGMGSQNQFTANKTMSDTAFAWKQLTLIDTLTTLLTDTITIRVSAENCDFCINKVYFDYIELTVTDTLTSIKDLDPLNNPDIKIYPNPSTSTITIDIKSKGKENYHLTIYNSTGQLIKTPETFKNSINFDTDDFLSGLYYYQIQRTIDKKVVGRGKFIIQ